MSQQAEKVVVNVGFKTILDDAEKARTRKDIEDMLAAYGSTLTTIEFEEFATGTVVIVEGTPSRQFDKMLAELAKGLPVGKLVRFDEEGRMLDADAEPRP